MLTREPSDSRTSRFSANELRQRIAEQSAWQIEVYACDSEDGPLFPVRTPDAIDAAEQRVITAQAALRRAQRRYKRARRQYSRALSHGTMAEYTQALDRRRAAQRLCEDRRKSLADAIAWRAQFLV